MTAALPKLKFQPSYFCAFVSAIIVCMCVALFVVRYLSNKSQRNRLYDDDDDDDDDDDRCGYDRKRGVGDVDDDNGENCSDDNQD